MKKLICILFFSFILLFPILILSNENNSANIFALTIDNNYKAPNLNNDSSNTNMAVLNKESNLTNYTYSYNLDHGIIEQIIRVINVIPIVVFVTISLYIISIYREKTKALQFYTVKTYIEKLKPDDFQIINYKNVYIKKSSHDIILDLIKKGVLTR